ncbi:hypothetical protein BpHYR1_027631 [Brachionus plicatilis]|uniref:Uncharacterized protein n=1 Tax=Brachionus plicatilis TaxID=10195 RepID=A0A3M7PGR2_BRAPC|nr:hypothetical protein BpHYR1_027631 [Brachionus plicatilis]
MRAKSFGNYSFNSYENELQLGKNIRYLHCMLQRDNLVLKISLQNTLQFSAFCTPLKSILIDCAIWISIN